MRQQLPWRSVARRPDSAAGREPKVSSFRVLLKPLRVKKRHHSRGKKRKQADSRQLTGKTRKGNAGGASARPGFPGAAGARPFEARPDGDRSPRRLNVSSDGYSEDGGRYLGICECSPRQWLPDVRQGLQRLLLTRPVQTYASQNPARFKQS